MKTQTSGVNFTLWPLYLGMHSIRGWVSFRDGLHVVANSKIMSLLGIEFHSFQPVSSHLSDLAIPGQTRSIAITITIIIIIIITSILYVSRKNTERWIGGVCSIYNS
jgi:hypothetical protein